MTEARACELVATALNIQGGVGISDTMATIAAWDSMAHTAIVLEIEAAIGRPLTSDEIAGIDSVRSVASLLGRSDD
jgi:acyl carrier protein